MSRAKIGRPAYEYIGGILFGLVVAGGVIAVAGMIHTCGWSNTFAEFLLVFILAAEGAYAWVHFGQAKAEDRGRRIASLYAEFDTARARRERQAIYYAPPENLCMAYLHMPEHKKERAVVESTIASLDRVCYGVLKLDVGGEDAYQMWCGMMLQVSHKLWPYILEQRELRRKDPGTHKVIYRRYLEEIVRQWIPRYAKEAGLEPPSHSLCTKQMLDAIFPSDSNSTANLSSTTVL